MGEALQHNNWTSTYNDYHQHDILPLQICRFVLEARTKNGTEYPANTLYHIIVGIMHHLRYNNVHVDFFRDKELVELCSTLDAEMKRIQGSGISSQPRQAEIITEEEEELLWEKGVLGDSTPQSLLDTKVYCCGLFFALCIGNEHRRLHLAEFRW